MGVVVTAHTSVAIVLESAVVCFPGQDEGPVFGEEQTCCYLHFLGSGDHQARRGHPEQGGPRSLVSSQHWESV